MKARLESNFFKQLDGSGSEPVHLLSPFCSQIFCTLEGLPSAVLINWLKVFALVSNQVMALKTQSFPFKVSLYDTHFISDSALSTREVFHGRVLASKFCTTNAAVSPLVILLILDSIFTFLSIDF